MSRYKQPYSLYKRGKYWYYRTYTADGVRTVAKSTGQTSKGRAKEYCDSLYLQGTLSQSSITFRQYAEHFFDDDSSYVKDRAKPLAKNSLRLQRTQLHQHIMPLVENYKICDINHSVLKQVRMNLLENKSTNYVISIMGTFKLIMHSAYKDRLISVNPFDFLDGLEKEYNQIDAFTVDEIKILLDKIHDEEFERMILLMALTGMRISECVGVELEDVKESNGLHYINLIRQFNCKEYKPLKGKYSRAFPIAPELIDLIGFRKGRFSTFYREFIPLKRTLESDNRGRLCFHSLRHFFITNTLSCGIPETKVNYYTGHRQKGINHTYINYKPEDMLEFLDWQKSTLEKLR